MTMTMETPGALGIPEEQQLTLSLTDHETMELARCESVIEEGLAVYVQVGHALWQIRESRLYRDTHATFEEYTQERWHKGKSEAYRLISASQVYHQIEAAQKAEQETSPIGDTPEHLRPANEAQARPLSQLPEEDRVYAWQQAVERAGGQPTAAIVQSVVDEMLPPKAAKEPDSVTAALFEVEPAVTQSRFVSPGPDDQDNASGEGDADDTPSHVQEITKPDTEDAGEAPESSPAESLAALPKDADPGADDAVDGNAAPHVAAPVTPATPVAAASAPPTSAAKPIATTAAKPAASGTGAAIAQPAGTVSHTILLPEDIDDWLWEKDWTALQALQEIYRIYAAGLYLTPDAEGAALRLTEHRNAQHEGSPILACDCIEAILVVRASHDGLVPSNIALMTTAEDQAAATDLETDTTIDNDTDTTEEN